MHVHLRHHAPAAPPSGRIGRRGAWPLLLAVGVAQITVVIDYWSLAVAIPKMATDFALPTTDLQWVLSAYLLSFAAMLVIGGRVGDIFGRRTMLLAGIAIFGIASLACGLAPTEELLVAFRVVQGVGAAMIFPGAMSVVTNAFPEERRGWAIGIVVGVANIGTAIGPFIGGLLTDLLDWRWVLLVNVPVAIVAFVLVLMTVVDTRDPNASRRVDVAGSVLLAAGIVGLTLAVDRADAWSAGVLAAVVAGAAVVLVVFVLVERRVREPLVDLALLRNLRFSSIALAGCLVNFAWAGGLLVVTLYLQQIRDLSPLTAGVVLLTMSAGVALSGPLTGHLSSRVPVPVIQSAAALLAASGLVLMTLSDSWGVVSAGLVIAGLGLGIAYTATNIGTLREAPPEQAGAASGITLTGILMAGALGVAAMGVLPESLSSGAALDAAGIDGALRVAAAVCVAAVLVLLPLVLRRAPRAQAEPASP